MIRVVRYGTGTFFKWHGFHDTKTETLRMCQDSEIGQKKNFYFQMCIVVKIENFGRQRFNSGAEKKRQSDCPISELIHLLQLKTHWLQNGRYFMAPVK